MSVDMLIDPGTNSRNTAMMSEVGGDFLLTPAAQAVMRNLSSNADLANSERRSMAALCFTLVD